MIMVTLERLLAGNPIFEDEDLDEYKDMLEDLLGLINNAKSEDNPYGAVAARYQDLRDSEYFLKGLDYRRLRMSNFIARDVLVWFYSWALPNKEAIKLLTEHRLIEIGAGRGYWANLVFQAGGDIICFDSMEDNPHQNLQWYFVTEGSVEKIAEHPNRTLFLCWPPCDHPLAYDCLKAYKGQTLIYVGEEGKYSCNGNADFWELLESEWDEPYNLYIPQWHGIHDAMYVYQRKSAVTFAAGGFDGG